MKQIRLWYKVILQINVKQTKGNGGFYLYLYPFGDLANETFMNVSIHPPFNETFWKALQTINKLQICYECKMDIGEWTTSIMDEK